MVIGDCRGVGALVTECCLDTAPEGVVIRDWKGNVPIVTDGWHVQVIGGVVTGDWRGVSLGEVVVITTGETEDVTGCTAARASLSEL